MDCVYVHGFGENLGGKRVRLIVDALEKAGYGCDVPDLHRPSFREVTISAALEGLEQVLRRWQGDGPRLLIGASMGGYVATRWAMAHGDWNGRLMLLAPGMGMAGRWPILVGEERMERWENEGLLRLPGPSERLEAVEWGFVQDMREQPAVERVPQGTVIIHGRRDRTVPIDISRRLSKCSGGARLLEVQDGHALMQSLDIVIEEALDILGSKER